MDGSTKKHTNKGSRDNKVHVTCTFAFQIMVFSKKAVETHISRVQVCAQNHQDVNLVYYNLYIPVKFIT